MCFHMDVPHVLQTHMFRTGTALFIEVGNHPWTFSSNFKLVSDSCCFYLSMSVPSFSPPFIPNTNSLLPSPRGGKWLVGRLGFRGDIYVRVNRIERKGEGRGWKLGRERWESWRDKIVKEVEEKWVLCSSTKEKGSASLPQPEKRSKFRRLVKGVWGWKCEKETKPKQDSLALPRWPWGHCVDRKGTSRRHRHRIPSTVIEVPSAHESLSKTQGEMRPNKMPVTWRYDCLYVCLPY